jgi:hypothetical protein
MNNKKTAYCNKLTVNSEKGTASEKSADLIIFFTGFKKKMYFCPGEMAEWSIAAVLKTVDPARGPGVRIPLSPPKKTQIQKSKNQEPGHITHFLGIWNLIMEFGIFILQRRDGRVVECGGLENRCPS